MKVKNRNEYHRRETLIEGDSLTKQQFKKDCDVMEIVRRHATTGLWDHLERRTPQYGDFSMATELHEALQLVDISRAEFMELPASVRDAVDNDPVAFLRALADPDGFHALVEAGMPVEPTYVPPGTPETPPAQGAPPTGAPPADPPQSPGDSAPVQPPT